MKKVLLAIVLLNVSIVFSQSNSMWKKTPISSVASIETSKSHIQKSNIYTLNIEALKEALNDTPTRENFLSAPPVILSFPNSDGILEQFQVFEASNFAEELQRRYPNIKSYAGQGLEDPTSVIRFSVSPLGFQSMQLSGLKPATFIEQISDDLSTYAVYKKEDRIVTDNFECEVTERVNRALNTRVAYRNADDSILRTYRLAVSATGEYTAYHGGTKALALAAINNTMTRVNGIFETDFNVTMELIGNTDDVIYTNSGSDPYGNTTGNYNSEVQSTLTSVIGEANYDVGHLFANLQNNGNAGCIGCVCVNNQKGRGWTSATVPIGDFFDVDYVAHEMGHQFGGNHTWTHGGNEGTNVQVEPGSGSTIMSYAGITGATDVQANVHPNFHAVTIEQITDYVKSTSCQTNTNLGNAVPVVNAGANYTIPNGTAFVLEGSATDADPGDALTYSWEQMDENNASTTYPSTTATTGVAFRAYEPTSESHRYFPRLQTTKTGATSWQWEAVPNVARTLNFRLTARDNRADGGTNNSDDMFVNVDGTAGPFILNSPNTNVTWNAGTTQAITWDVAGTTGNGINAANVDIYLSTDGGDTYPIVLALAVPNDGAHNVVIPNNQGSQNRIMVRGTDNIFFDISNSDFTIGAPVVCNETVPTGLTASNVTSISATLNWDAVPGATYDFRYRIVGSPTWITDAVVGTVYNLSGLTPLTQYESQVRSLCSGGSGSAYSSSVLFTTLDVPVCIGTEITSFPYLETFDSGIADWTQASGDDGDWTLDANGTQSNNTGPSDDITGGGNYFYTEASNGGGGLGANATVILISPCFNLSSLAQASFSFYYHMYGSNVGSLDLEITTDNGDNWTNVFSANGNLGNSWNGQNVDLNTYLGQTVKFRFIGVTGGGWSSDIALDHIGVGDPIIPDYCASNGNSTADEYINGVQLNTLNNANSGAGTTSTGYSDFTSNLGLTTTLSGGTEYTITITPEWPGTIYDEGYAVWIDYNRDGDFFDSGELVWTQVPTQATSVSGTFTVPFDVSYGSATRMRVSLKFNGIPTPCEAFDFGEVEDYTINLAYDGLLFTNNNWTPNAPSDMTVNDNALILDGTYAVSSDIKLNDLIVNSGADVDVTEGESISLNGDLSNNGNLILNSSSVLYSSLIVNGTVSGDVIYNRHVNINASIGERDLVSAPVTGQTFANFAAPNSNLFSNPVNTTEKLFGPFDKASGTYLTYDTNIPAEAAIVLNPGTGYRAASTDDGTFEFKGAVNSSTVIVDIFNSGTTFTEWNLIGNPFPSYILLSDFLADNIGEFFPTNAGVYGYDGNASDGWKIWNTVYSIANPDAIIAPGQGFLVSSKIGGGSVIFDADINTDIRTIASGNSDLDDDFIDDRNANRNEISYLKLEMASSSEIYSTDFYFTNLASSGLDIGFDATVFNNTAPNYAIYSHLVEDNEGKDFAIQSVRQDDLYNDIVIPLGINATQGQQINISINTSTLSDDIDVYLEDNLSSTFTLLNTADYNFTADSHLSGTGRFFLRFESETLSNTEFDNNELIIYTTANPKEVVFKGNVMENTNAILYDIHGREVLSQSLELNKNIQTMNVSSLSSGVYIIKIQSDTFVQSQKLIIR